MQIINGTGGSITINGVAIANGVTYTVLADALVNVCMDPTLWNLLNGDTVQLSDGTNFWIQNDAKMYIQRTLIAFQKDSDGAQLSRVKAAPTGWVFQMRFFEFTTAKYDAIVNKDAITDDALADITAKFYKSNGDEVVLDGGIGDAAKILTIVKTVIDFEPTYDYYIIGGHCKVVDLPSSNIRLSVVAVPDIAAPTGSKIMIQGANFKIITPDDKIDTDGRSGKFLAYNATYHTNKLRFILRHAAAAQESFMVGLEHFKQ